MMNENVHHDQHFAEIHSMRERNRCAIDSPARILVKGETEGMFRSGIDPIDLHIPISALSFYNASNRHIFHHNFGVDFANSVVRVKPREQIVQCVSPWVPRA